MSIPTTDTHDFGLMCDKCGTVMRLYFDESDKKKIDEKKIDEVREDTGDSVEGIILEEPGIPEISEQESEVIQEVVSEISDDENLSE